MIIFLVCYCSCHITISILYYDMIYVSETIDVNNKTAFKESIIWHYWYFLNKWFKFESSICKDCHDILMMSFDINNFDYHCIVFSIKGKVIKMIEKYVSDNKRPL